MGIIIYPPTIDWTWMKQRPQHLMYQLAENGHTIYYCNKTQKSIEVEQVHRNLYIVHDHKEWLQTSLPSIRKKHSFIGVWCSYPLLFPTLSSYQPDWIVYDCIDDFPEWIAYEKGMVSISNQLVCSSQRLYSRLRRTYPSKAIEHIPNAYDHGMGLHKTIEENLPPSDIRKLANQKILGYVGAWAPWIDEKLIWKISKLDLDISVIIIGPEFGKKFQVPNNHNIHFLGMKSHHDLPSYVKHFSVCIIPFKITDVTLATNPVKAYEYLASGKPVVSTNLPECRLMIPHIDISQTHEEFIQHIKKRIVNPGDPLPRINYALENTWVVRGKKANEIIQRLNLV